MYKTVLVSALAALSAAAPVTTAAADSSYAWEVTGWSAGCARAGCYYDFNVTGTAASADDSVLGNNVAVPAFKAYCSGDDSDIFKQCTVLEGDSAVAAKLKPNDPENPGAHIAISLQFNDEANSAYYNYTGYGDSIFNQFVAPLQNFTVTPSEAWGVA